MATEIPNTTDQLKFLDYRKPMMEAGNYTFTIAQTYGDPKANATTTATQTLDIKVRGERLRLTPEQIFAKYPPSGEHGNFNDTLPHISLKKASLPWERSAYRYDDDEVFTKQSDEERYEPWLYLMLINEADIARGDAKIPTSVPVSALKEEAYVPQGYFESLMADVASGFLQAEEAVQVVDVKKRFFNTLIAEIKEDLQYLAHIRQRYDEAGDTLTRELSVIVGNRFAQSDPKAYPSGMANHVLLVSLEGYLNDDAQLGTDQQSNYATGDDMAGTLLEDLDDDVFVRFVVLTSWSFTSKEEKINFEQRSKTLDVGSLRLPSKDSSPEHPYLGGVPKRDGGTPFDEKLQAGMSAIPHQFRLGDRSVSWYRGPCVPFNSDLELNAYEKGEEADQIKVPTDADKLLGYLTADGMFDISYAAAYELGRFLGMKNEGYTRSLARYKRAKSRYVFLQKDDEDRSQDVIAKGITIENLPYAKLRPQELEEDKRVIIDFLRDLAQLKGIPHWYVLTDHNLLPQRTIRTFHIDIKWMQSLWLGVLSLGGRAVATHQCYEELYPEFSAEMPQAGFFLRSDLVWAYPEMLVTAKLNDTDCTLIRQEELTPDLLLVLTDTPFNYLSLELPAEALHYGADVIDASVSKSIKYANETVSSVAITDLGLIDAEGILKVGALAGKIKEALKDSDKVDQEYKDGLGEKGIASARFSRFMLEGEPKVEFRLGGNS